MRLFYISCSLSRSLARSFISHLSLKNNTHTHCRKKHFRNFKARRRRSKSLSFIHMRNPKSNSNKIFTRKIMVTVIKLTHQVNCRSTSWWNKSLVVLSLLRLVDYVRISETTVRDFVAQKSRKTRLIIPVKERK